jgi:hypothetical protein
MVVPDIPYHVTQRGNRREDVFLSDSGRRGVLRVRAGEERTCRGVGAASERLDVSDGGWVFPEIYAGPASPLLVGWSGSFSG